MGWWDMDEDGSSFAGSLLWGDEPADALDEMLSTLTTEDHTLTLDELYTNLETVFKGEARSFPQREIYEIGVAKVTKTFARLNEPLDWNTLRAGVLFSTLGASSTKPLYEILQ